MFMDNPQLINQDIIVNWIYIYFQAHKMQIRWLQNICRVFQEIFLDLCGLVYLKNKTKQKKANQGSSSQ